MTNFWRINLDKEPLINDQLIQILFIYLLLLSTSQELSIITTINESERGNRQKGRVAQLVRALC